MPYTTELMTFAVKPGKEERADVITSSLTGSNAKRPDCGLVAL
jgi:hypothetical protein